MELPNLIREMDPAALSATAVLTQAGGHVYVVGGAVRDLLLQKRPKDFDLLILGLNKGQIKSTLKSIPNSVTKEVGKNFGVFLLTKGEFTCEIAMPREEYSTGAGHKDFAVTVNKDLNIVDDLKRRDFTANSIAVDTETGTLIDPYNGVEDLFNGQLTVVNPFAFQEDPLRIIRALVAFSVNGLMPDDATASAIKENASKIRFLPGERIQKEMDKLMTGANPAGAIKLAYDLGVLKYIVPEVEVAMGFDQKNSFHDLDAGNHMIKVLDVLSKYTDDPDLRMAGLLHDIGKLDSQWIDEQGVGHHYMNNDYPESDDHDLLGANLAREYLKRLNYSNDRIDRITTLIEHHMFSNFTTLAGARRFLNNCDGDVKLAFDLLDLREADARGKLNETQVDLESIREERMMLQQIVEQDQGTTVKDLHINGHDLIGIGITPGPPMGAILKQLVDLIIENPALNKREILLEKAKELNAGILGG